ncbi:hypothetical protein KP509_37G016700 [Ceratopteris richardii]|uniref:Uncharacterized protein n=1 Tax=Ceratopteris richardii TaxID=49495 RepID=A0A8T2Q5Z3_CERRI|nr:hypothetical protein KP509_37G016700 [Ceratopteris richardii]
MTMLQTITSMRFLASVLWNSTKENIKWTFTTTLQTITSMRFLALILWNLTRGCQLGFDESVQKNYIDNGFRMLLLAKNSMKRMCEEDSGRQVDCRRHKGT